MNFGLSPLQLPKKTKAFSIINIVKTKFHNLNYYLILYFKRKIILNLVYINNYRLLWGPIDPIGTIRMEKGWAYGPIPSPRIKAYPRTIR